ncbi:MAG: helix-turn-helix domain-containing protein [Comamonadaceae bacterium]|nr:MAG: helix-turn-helix domain-containing protein [Comamonadaceae bacterium]
MEKNTSSEVGRLITSASDVPRMRAFGCDLGWSALPAGLCTQPDVAMAFDGPVWMAGEPLTASEQADVVLVVSRTPKQLVARGATRYKRICMDRVAAFLAFLDAAPRPRQSMPSSMDVRAATRLSEVVLTATQDCVASDDAFRAWLFKQVFESDPTHQAMIRYARSREAYSLISFLLQDHAQGRDRLLDICRTYGLSTSYFRKLCKKMLGHNAKSTLSHWRAVNALLDIVTKSHSILNVALVNGYSSASHISRDIHRKFGYAPSAFRDKLFDDQFFSQGYESMTAVGDGPHCARTHGEPSSSCERDHALTRSPSTRRHRPSGLAACSASGRRLSGIS